MGSSFSHAASRVHLNLAQHVAVMARFDTVGSTHPAAVGRVAASGTVGPFQHSLFQEMVSFFVVPGPDPYLYFAVVQLFGLGSRVLKFSLAIERVPGAYAHQSIHDQTIIALGFQEHKVTRASMTKPYLRWGSKSQSIDDQTLLAFAG